MTAESSLVGVRVRTPGSIAQERARDHRFFTAMALAAGLTVFIGFAPTYYLRSTFGMPPLATPLVHVHGVLYTLWVLLYIAQTSLVAARRTDIHRRLGVAGALLVLPLLVVGWLTAIAAARRGVTPPGGPPPLAFLSVPLGTLVVFAILVATGLWNRRRSEIHKRLMLLATIALITPAIARFRFFMPGGPLLTIGGTWAFLIACLVYDRLSHGRIHPAFLWGGLFVMVSLPFRFAIGATGAWRAIAEWLTA